MPGRTDRATDPAVVASLALGRRAQAFWSRALAEVRDDELHEPARTSGWTRAQVIADVAYDARTIASLVGSVRTGTPAVLRTPSARRNKNPV